VPKVSFCFSLSRRNDAERYKDIASKNALRNALQVEDNKSGVSPRQITQSKSRGGIKKASPLFHLF
jgi:hypothetical protein